MKSLLTIAIFCFLLFSFNISIAQPDLIIEHPPMINPTSVGAGGVVTVTFKVTNKGNSTAGTSLTAFYISTKNYYDNTASIITDHPIPSLTTVTYGPVSKTFSIDGSLSPGNYYILVRADFAGEVSENDETNNTAFVPITISTSQLYGDLKVLIEPQDAINRGAQWKTNRSWWASSGSTVNTVFGNCTLEFSDVPGYIKPANKTVTIIAGTTVNETGIYVPSSSSYIISSLNNLDFTNTCVSTIKKFTLTNSGAGILTIQPITSVPAKYSTDLVSTRTIQPGSSTDVYVNFSPTGPGVYSGSLLIQSNASNGNIIVSLNGTCASTSGRTFQLNITPLNINSMDNPSVISHLRWPFSSSKWNDNFNSSDRDFWSNGDENPISGGTGHRKKGHTLGEAYADDWNRTNGDCDFQFFSPVAGTIIHINPHCEISDHYCSKPMNEDSTCSNGFGINIIIQCTANQSFAFRVAHLNYVNSLLAENTLIDVGTYIGNIGSTGNSSGSHAHCVLYQNINNTYPGTGKAAIERLKNGNALGINKEVSIANEFAAAFKFDAVSGGGLGDGGGTGINYISEISKQIKLFPNPSNGIFDIQFENANEGQMSYQVLSLLGQQLSNGTFQTHQGTNIQRLELSELTSGIYILCLYHAGSTSIIRVVIN